ncbi:hypothetical protein [Intestinibacter sp.]
MYKRYILENNEELMGLVNNYEHIGKEIMEDKRENIKEKLDKYITKEDKLDLTEIQKDWFPMVKADIFISHSHKDIKVVNALVGWLTQKFKVDVFVDSYVWGYCDELLRMIDEKYCRHINGKYFDYDKRNISTTHVHTLLTYALNNMIDNTECIIFLDTENSLCIKNDIEVGTSSAWIYSEIIATKLLRINEPERIIEKRDKYSKIYKNFKNIYESYEPLFRMEANHLISINASRLREIASNMNLNKEDYLDRLYFSE